MDKGLKALQELVDTMPIVFYESETLLNCVKIIEKELKEYEKMKSIKGTTTFDNAIEETLINACPNVAKKLKALEIIKEHIRLNSHKYESDETYGLTEYMFFITKEEYLLLREVLL